MKSINHGFSQACRIGAAGIAVLLASASPSWAGLPVPAPLVGVTGPFGLIAAGVGCGGYLLYKRFRNRA